MDRIRLDARRLAVIGCIYGNVPALEACLADAQAAGCDGVLGAGDILGFCGHAAEALALVERSCAAAIAGDHEREVVAGTGLGGCGFAGSADEPSSSNGNTSLHQADGLDVADLLHLARWPTRMVVDTPGGGVLLCHGSPDRLDEFLYAGTLDPQRLRWWLAEAGAQAMVCSHTDVPWILDAGRGLFAVNTGAAGKPDHDGDPAVHYAIIEPAGPRACLRRVTYDHRSWAARLVDEGVEPCIAGQLVTGRWSWGMSALSASLEVM